MLAHRTTTMPETQGAVERMRVAAIEGPGTRRPRLDEAFNVGYQKRGLQRVHPIPRSTANAFKGGLDGAQS